MTLVAKSLPFLAIAVSLIFFYTPVPNLLKKSFTKRPQQIPRHYYEVVPDMISDSQHKRFMKLFESLGEFPSALSDVTSKIKHIGEAVDPDSNGNCGKPYLMYNPTLKKCVFPSRIDIGRHFLLSGGYDGWKEKYDTIVSRAHPFINYQFDTTEREEFVELFTLPKFKKAAESVCRNYDAPIFKPFQLSLILNMPGQSVPQHLDIPFFNSASRYIYPQWLLLVMQESKLFRHERIPQVQALLYLHDWNLTRENYKSYSDFGGEFILYPDGVDYEPVAIPAEPKLSLFCDGSEAVHATSTYKPSIKPLPLTKDEKTHMKYEDNLWYLFIDDKKTDHSYSWYDIRASVAYRGWCFKTQEDADSYDPHNLHYDENSLDEIFDILSDELVTRGVISQDKITTMRKNMKTDPEEAYNFGVLLLDSFMEFPPPFKSIIPFNYCVIFKALPKNSVFKFMEDTFC